MCRIMQNVVAWLSDRNIQLVVRADGYELPAVRFIIRQVVIYHGRLGRIIETILDALDFRYSRELGNVESHGRKVG